MGPVRAELTGTQITVDAIGSIDPEVLAGPSCSKESVFQPVSNASTSRCWNTSTLAGTLHNCGTLSAKIYTTKPGSTMPCKPLPVQLLTFTAKLALGAVKLTSTTAQEVRPATKWSAAATGSSLGCSASNRPRGLGST